MFCKQIVNIWRPVNYKVSFHPSMKTINKRANCAPKPSFTKIIRSKFWPIAILQECNQTFLGKWLWGQNIKRCWTHTHTHTLWWDYVKGTQEPAAAAAAAKSLQSFPTLCDPIDSSPPGSPVPGILQARTWSGRQPARHWHLPPGVGCPLEWVATSFSNAWKWKVKVKSLSPNGQS